MQRYPRMPLQLAFLTRHNKQAIVAPMLKTHLGLSVVHTDAFDTDKLGSFDNKNKRLLSAKDCALKKAYLACKLTGLNAGLGSEGSFNSVFGMGVVNQEILAYADIKNNIEVCAGATAPIALEPARLERESDIKALFDEHPGQAWHLMQEDEPSAVALHTGIKRAGECRKLAEQYGYPLYLSPDFRLMHCPKREATISGALRDLIKRLSSLCPNCQAPDFIHEQTVSGLPCELCGAPTNLAKAFKASCIKCGNESLHTAKEKQASSFNCSFCNP